MITNEQNIYKLKIIAPAKIILTGQHSILYGEPAIAIAINKYCSAQLIKTYIELKQNSIILMKYQYQNKMYNLKINNLQQLIKIMKKYIQQNNQLPELQKFIKQIQKQNKIYYQYYQIIPYSFIIIYKFCLFLINENKNISSYYNYQIKILNQISIGKGLGSSSAINCILAAIILELCQHGIIKPNNMPIQLINKISFTFQKIQHGTPSGLDNYVSSYGGIIINQNNKFISMKKQSIMKLKQEFVFALIDTGQFKNTKEAIKRVKQKLQINYQNKIILEEIGNCTRKILKQLECSTHIRWKQEILQCLQKNNELLIELGLMTKSMQNKRCSVKDHFCTKITGSGMGGYLLLVGLNQYVSEIPKNVTNISIDDQGIRSIVLQ